VTEPAAPVKLAELWARSAKGNLDQIMHGIEQITLALAARSGDPALAAANKDAVEALQELTAAHRRLMHAVEVLAAERKAQAADERRLQAVRDESSDEED
jgi:hypothetical protein